MTPPPNRVPPESRCMAMVPACGAVQAHRCPYAWTMRVLHGYIEVVVCGRHGRSKTALAVVVDRFEDSDTGGRAT